MLSSNIPYLQFFLALGLEMCIRDRAWGGAYTLDEVYECDRMARAYVLAHI